MSSSIASRAKDIHEAFSDTNVKMVLPVIGGYNSNQLLPHLDYDLIAKNPKYFGGYSDTTALQNAINSKTELTTFQSPAFSMFGKTRNNEYAINYFKKCFFENGEYEISPSEKWDDDSWYLDQESYELFENEGFWYIQNGSENEVQGKIIGGNLCTLNLLQGTEYMPKFIEDTILFLEDDYESKIGNFDRDLTSLIQQENFKKYIKAVLIGRFQRKSEINKEILTKMILNKQELANIPVIANLNFGHTYPAFSFPIGGICRLENGRIFVQYN
jgi:muramoyltetrapeptide carboxypeptidase LdcA involved in peptidoglycan recycling